LGVAVPGVVACCAKAPNVAKAIATDKMMVFFIVFCFYFDFKGSINLKSKNSFNLCCKTVYWFFGKHSKKSLAP
jgi:hypothetical protein